jgi:hypothetical protein
METGGDKLRWGEAPRNFGLPSFGPTGFWPIDVEFLYCP